MENNSGGTGRIERDEYRMRSGTVNGKSPSGKKTKTDYFIRLTLLQGVLCLVIIGIVVAVGKMSPSANERMKSDYSGIMSENMSVGQVIEQIGDALKMVFLPSSPDGGENAVAALADVAVSGQRVHTPTEIAGTEVQSYDVTSGETGETVAVAEIIYDGTGGEDLDKGEAIKGTSFAPYTISADVRIPVENARVTSPFGYRINPVSGNYGFHTGIDLAVAEGTPVSAAFYGKVKECGEDDVWGKYILLEHSDNCETYYCHLSEIYVTEGAVIRQGETVGLVGSTGWSTGPHLHFEVRINGVRVDPEPLLFPEGINED